MSVVTGESPGMAVRSAELAIGGMTYGQDHQLVTHRAADRQEPPTAGLATRAACPRASFLVMAASPPPR